MLPENVQQQLMEELELFITYGVETAEQVKAKELVKKYHHNAVGLEVLLEFYKTLPEAREEAVIKLSLIDTRQGVTLLTASTANHIYTVVVSEHEVHILGEYGKEPIPDEILSWFGHADTEKFISSYGPVTELMEYGVEKSSSVCPICQVTPGELHLLGCPVEICPWCDGQLNKCNCRFEKLDVESLESEEDVEKFQDLLDEKGRIPFDPDHKLAYPGTSKGLDK